MNSRRLILPLVALLAAGCASAPPPKPVIDQVKTERYQSRVAVVSSIERWSFNGKLSLSNGEDGGSGRLRWSTEPGFSELDFRGTMGRGAWQLDITPGLSVLDLANGERWEAPGVSDLVQDHLGWSIPVDALSWWVRGVAAPGTLTLRTLDNDGRLETLRQHGWLVNFEQYKAFSGVTMPTRLEARNGSLTVKLVMRGWTFPVQSGNDS